jgi:hypothetical protein
MVMNRFLRDLETEILLVRLGTILSIAYYVPVSSVSHRVSSPIMQTGQEFKFLKRQLLGGYAQFLVQFSNGSILYTRNSTLGNIRGCVNFRWRHPMQWVSAASICPYLNNEAGKQIINEDFSGETFLTFANLPD